MAKVYQIKVQLRGFTPSNYRTILLESDCTFEDLHLVIQDAFCLWNYHLYDFNFPDGMRLVPDIDGFDIKLSSSCRLVDTAELEKYLVSVKDSCTYAYDFGDDWTFKVTLQKVLDEEKVQHELPFVLRRKGPGLIEDCGGVYSLMEMLKVYHSGNYDEASVEPYGFESCEDFETAMRTIVEEE